MVRKTISAAKKAERKAKDVIKRVEKELENSSSGGTPAPAVPVPVSEPPESEPAQTEVVLNYNLAYILSKPNSDGRVLKIVTRGTKMTTLSAGSAGWTRVETRDTEPKVKGYIKTVFLKPSEE